MTGEEAFACMTCGLERWLFVCSSGHIDTGAVGANANSGTGVRNGLIVSCTLQTRSVGGTPQRLFSVD